MRNLKRKRLRIRSWGFGKWIFFLLFFITAPCIVYGKPTIYVTNYPLKYFAERIAGGTAEIILPIPKGINSVLWMPDTGTILQMQEADLILINGATHEKWLPLFFLPEEKVINTSISFEDLYIRIRSASPHRHGPQSWHAHEIVRYTTWLDFQLVTKQVIAIRDALLKTLPEKAGQFKRNFKLLEHDLGVLDRKFYSISGSERDRTLLASCPVYDYFARRYGLNVRSLFLAPQAAPNPEQWRAAEKIIAECGAKWMIWEDKPLKITTERLKKLGVKSTVFSTCGKEPVTGDFLDIMYKNLENLESVFR